MHNVIVSGGSRGLGLGICQALASSGFRVIALARRESEQLAALSSSVAGGGKGSVHFHRCNLEEIEKTGDLIRSIQAKFGIIYGLVNNAAAGISGMLTTVSDASVGRAVQLNVTSPLVLTKYAVRSMMLGKGGRIVNISSIVSTTGFAGLSTYSATKASLIGFTRSLAREVGSLGITVNAVAPGFIDTDMTKEMGQAHRSQIERRSALRRMAEVSDIAEAVDFLFSEKARNITGTVVTVDAGGTA